MGATAARGAKVTLIGQGISIALQVGSLTVLGRLLSPSDYGVFAMVIAIVGVAQLLGDFGLSLAAVQAKELSGQQRNNLFWTNAVLGAVLSLIVVGAASPISDFYGRPELANVTRVIAVAFLINALATQFRAELSRALRFRAIVASDVGAQVAGLAVAIAFAVSGAGYWALVFQQVTVAVVTLVILVGTSGWFPGLPRRGHDMASFYTFGLNALGVQIISYVSSNIDNVVVGKYVGVSSLGVYNRAYQLYRLPLNSLAAPMTRVAMPILSRLQNDPAYEDYLARAQTLLTYTFGGSFFIAAGLADPVIDILLGPQWDGVKPIFTVLAIGGVFQAMGYIYYWVFISLGFTALQLKFTVYGRVAMVGAIIVGLNWGPIGVACGASFGQALMWFTNSFLAIPKTGMNARRLMTVALRPLTIYTLMCAAAWGTEWLVSGWNPWLELAVLSVVMTLIMGSAIIAVRTVRDDVRTIWTFVARARG